MHHFLSKKLKKISEGDEAAFRQLVRVYYDRLFQFALGMVKNKEDAEEIIGDVFLKIWQLRKQLPGKDKFSAYLYRAVKNTALNYIKKENRKKDFERLYDIHIENKQCRSPEDLVISEERMACIRKAINTLPLRCRQIFILVKEEGMSYREVAELLNLSPATVNVQMTIAVKKLWKALDWDHQIL